MPLSRFDEDARRDDAGNEASPVHPSIAAPEAVVVVSRAQVNLIVLSRIVERARLRPIACAPELSQRLIDAHDPLAVILDGGPDLHDCDAAFEAIGWKKRQSGGMRPHVVLLTMRNMNVDEFNKGGLVDTLVAKPVTPERLQPLMERLRDRSI